MVGHPRALDQKARFKARTAQLLLAFVVELLPLPRPNLALLLLLAAEALQLCDHGPRMHDPAPQARGWGSQPPPFARARRESVPHVHVRNVPRQGVELLHFGALVGEIDVLGQNRNFTIKFFFFYPGRRCSPARTPLRARSAREILRDFRRFRPPNAPFGVRARVSPRRTPLPAQVIRPNARRRFSARTLVGGHPSRILL